MKDQKLGMSNISVSEVKTGLLSESGLHNPDKNSVVAETIEYPQITNQEVMEVAQALRTSKVTSNATMNLKEVAATSNFIPAQSRKNTDEFNVTMNITVESSKLLDKTKFFLDTSLRDTRGMPIDSTVIAINHSKQVNDFYLPKVPPTINIVPGDTGGIVLEISQNDITASEIIVFYRPIDLAGANKYTHFKTFDLFASDEKEIAIFDTAITEPTIFRAISMSRNGIAGNFTDTIAFPHANSSKYLTQKQANGVLKSSISQSAILVQAAKIVGNFSAVCIVRKNITANEKVFLQITDYFMAQGDAEVVSILDSDLVYDNTYEYKLQFLLPNGDTQVSDDSEIATYTQLFNSPSFSTSMAVTTPANSQGQYGAKFSLGLSSKNETSEMLVYDMLKRSGNSGLYDEEKFSSKDMLVKLYLFNVTRKNLTTGAVDEMGIFPQGMFADAGSASSKNGIMPPHKDNSYEYTIELICNDVEQVIEELNNTAKIRSTKEYDDSPYANGQKSTDKIFDPNNKSKFFSQQSLLKSTISTGASLEENHANGTLGMNKTGFTRKVFLSSQSSKIIIKNAKSKSNEYGNVTITWSVKGPAYKIDHFIIMASRPGYTYPCGVRHHYNDQGTYTFVDTTQSRVMGSVAYSVIPVFLDFSRGESVLAGTVPIMS